MMIFKSWKLVLLSLVFASFCVVAQQQPLEIEGFRVPEYDKNGVMTSQLFGDRAVMQDGGIVKITGAVMDYYNNGETIIKIKAPTCLFDQKNSVANSDGAVEVEMEGAKIQGTGFDVRTADKILHIFHDSKVVIDSSNENVNKDTTINSEELYFDYSAQIVRFVDDVDVDDSRIRLKCQKMRVKFDDNDEVERIDATGDVQSVLVEGDAETIVISDKLFMNYKEQKGHFEGAVHVTDSQMNMACKILDVSFGDGEQQIETIDANDDVNVVFYDASGETIIDSDKLRMDYVAQKSLFRGNVHVEDPKMSMDCDALIVKFGEGERQFDKINAVDNVNVIFMTEDRTTNVTAGRMDVDYSTQMGVFEKDVHVEDVQMVMDCDLVNVRFDENNQIDWIEAMPSVTIVSEGRTAIAGKAEYDMKTDEVLLSDDPKILQGPNMIMGDQIRIWRTTGKIICEPSARLVMYDQEDSAGPDFNFFGNQ